MDFSFNNSVWQAQNLPEGFSFNGGILSGSANSNGSFTVPITVTTDFGSDTKNITINVRARPGSDKFSILQNGTEIEKVSIPQLVASIRDGSALLKYNCYNTQIVIPLTLPHLYINDLSVTASSQSVPLNFCDFQYVTLADGSIAQGLVLQFSKSLWLYYSGFDFPDSRRGYYHNRWKFSLLRQWLNSSGSNWFSPAYTGDAFGDFDYNFSGDEDEIASFFLNDSLGFLSLLHEDFRDALQPIRVVTAAYWDEDFNMPETELIDNSECDVTFDKVFIPSLSQMAFSNNDDGDVDVQPAEGSPWAFYSSRRENEAYFVPNNLYDDLGLSNYGYNYSVSVRTPTIDSHSQIAFVGRNGSIGITHANEAYLYPPVPAFVLC